MKKSFLMIALLLAGFCFGQMQPHTQIHGIFPHTSISGNLEQCSETGIGALIPWANKLWAVGYVAHILAQALACMKWMKT